MTQLIPERYSGLVGLGVGYLWVVTVLFWMDWTQSEVIFVKIVGFAAAALASLSGLSVFLYVDGLESEVKDLRSKNCFYEEQAKDGKRI